MEIVEYKCNDPWVGHMDCPNCKSSIYAWQSSGMSESFPHFYCDKCSNVILRESDKGKVWNGVSEEILKEIESSLPNCECGGKFKAEANPKCPNCGFEFKHQNNSLQRLTDPHMILINNAILYDENGPKYSVKITK
jgi:DNA-directed RNA polymerase subunit M/transcription elongation factor TFIIS